MLELCRISKKRRELMWGLSEGSELEDSPSYRKILSQVSRRMPTFQEEMSAIETRPPMSSPQDHSTMAFDSRTSSPRDIKRRNLGYVESYLRFFPDDELPVALCRDDYEEEDEDEEEEEKEEEEDDEDEDTDGDTQRSSDEECFALASSNSARTSTSKNYLIYRKAANGQAAQIYRSTRDEIRPPQRDERRTYRNEIPEQRRITQGCSSHRPQPSSRRQPAVPQVRSPDQAQAVSPPYFHQTTARQGGSPGQATTNSRGCSHQSAHAAGCSSRANSRRYSQHPTGSQVGSYSQAHENSPRFFHQTRSPGSGSAGQGHLHQPIDPQGYLHRRSQASNPHYLHQPTGSRVGSLSQAQASSRRHLHQQISPQGSLPGQDRPNDRGYSYQPIGASDCSPQSNSRGYSHHHVQTTYAQRNTQQNEMRPTQQRRMDWNNGVRTPPQAQQTQQFTGRRIAQVALPRQFNTIQNHQNQPLVTMRRPARQEMREVRHECRRRRIAVCLETDDTQERRIFVRVLGKRF